jgi:hypothetical protein
MIAKINSPHLTKTLIAIAAARDQVEVADKCKFCGLYDTKIEGVHGSYHVICCCCEAQGPKGHTKVAAVSLWNGSPKIKVSHEPLIRQSLVASTCDYEPNSGEPCSSCPRQVSQLYRCGFLQEEAGILQEPEHNPLNT